MAGTAVTPPPLTGNGGVGSSGGGVAPNSGLSASELNSFRISAVIDRLSLHFRSHRKGDTVEFLNLCLSLARLGMDELRHSVSVIAFQTVPDIVLQDFINFAWLFPGSLIAVIFVILVSLTRGIDFAIANHEVPSRSQDLPLLIKQVCQGNNDTLQQAAVMVLMISVKNACQNGWFSDRDSEDLKNLAKEIASNFCSVSDLNTEPSCALSVISTIMSRFYPRMKMGHIFAFVEVKPGFDAYVSDFQISKSLKSSPGDKIRLFVVQTDSIETSSCLITPPKANFLLNGKGVERRNNLCMDPGAQIPTVVTHLLKYGSNLLQAVGEFNVAFLSEMPIPDSNALQDYEQHAPAAVDAGAVLEELYYSEIIEGPSRISLNCPISFTRIKTPVKGHACKHIQVLKEVGPNVSDIIFSSDGSWNAVPESNDAVQKPDDKTEKTLDNSQDKSPQPEDVLDLTQTDDAMDAAVATHEIADKKLLSPHQSQFTTPTIPSNPPIANTNDVNQNNVSLDNDFWSGIYMSTFGQGSSNVRPDPPVLTDSFVSPNREIEAFHGNNALGTPSMPQTGTPLSNVLQLQQYQFGNPIVTNEYGRFPSFPRNVTRTPTAVQALPAQTPTSVLQQTISPRNSVNASLSNGLSAASQTSPSIRNSLPQANPHQVSQMSSSLLYQRPVVQQNRSFPSVQPPQQNIGLQAPNHLQNAYRVPNECQNSSQPMRMRRVPSLVQSSVQSSGSFLRPLNRVGVSQDGTQQSHLIAAANRSVHMAIDPSRTAALYSMNQGDQRGNTGISSPPVTRTDTYDPTAEQNWRPAGRMRGALSGQAYADALNQFIIRPNQQSQPQGARPISNVSSVPTNVPSQLQPFIGGPGQAVRPGGSDVLPDGSAGMH
ncbi:hypothetical protein BUALT_Bualt05G0051200 [Buddleja alternifolia]|uniref:Uncharacterized protein n=1 Tax=Buddleja alternifolia TaxID=168488 RepID=A0AAV6XPU7_9LAMI|nr:hypothetical protein BUALT_Bualt05G0051200 [Buddleja alternifolia]